MQATDVIRTILDIIDSLDAETPQGPTASVTINQHESDDVRHFKQIIDLISSGEYSTQPQPAYASIDAVTTGAGAGLNGPKPPEAIKGTTMPLYPGRC